MRRVAGRHALLVLVLAVLMLCLTWPGSARASNRQAPAEEQELADRFAPIMMLKRQRFDCDSEGEPFAPMNVDAVLGNAEVALRQLGQSDPVRQWGPAAADVADLGGGFYLDFPGDALDPGCLYERDSRRFTDDSAPTVYAHIVRDPDEPGILAVQYWFFYYYNDWNNKHEGDWEGIQLLFRASSVRDALVNGPYEIGVAQHEGGQRVDWDDGDRLEREGDHPVVYPSARSHATYLSSAVFLGRGADEGFGCDSTDGPSLRIEPQVVVLPHEPPMPPDPLSWLGFQGRWGESNGGPFNAPTGPATKGRWSHPLEWQEDLRTASVTIPGGGAAGDVTDAFCGVVEYGSAQLVKFKSSPMTMTVAVLVLGWAALTLARRTSWRDSDPIPVVDRRRFGEILRASFHLFASRPGLFVRIGLCAVPIAAVTGAAAFVLRRLPVVRDLLAFLEPGEGSRLVISAAFGGVTTTIVLACVVAIVAASADRLEKDQPVSVALAVADVQSRRGDLTTGFVRAAATVIVLALTVVGLPWAVKRLVDSQFVIQTVMLDGTSGRAAPTASKALIKRRWWHTALVCGVVSLLTLGLGIVVGLGVLVAFPSLPMWTLSGIVTAVSIAAIPLGAIVLVLLFGDARASRPVGERVAAEPATAP